MVLKTVGAHHTLRARIKRSSPIGKAVSAAYHLNNRESKRELYMFVDNKRLVFQLAPKYLIIIIIILTGMAVI